MTTERRRLFLSFVAVTAVASTISSACGTSSARIEPGSSATEESSTPDPPAADGPAPGQGGAEFRAAIPGLYVPDSFDVDPLPSGAMSVHGSGPCATVREVLLAGDWQLLDELAAPVEVAELLSLGGISPMLLLRNGSAVAFAQLRDGADGCDAVVGLAATGPVLFEAGDAHAAGDGWGVATQCIATNESIEVDVVAGVGDTSALIHVSIEGSGPERRLLEGSSSDNVVITGPITVLGAMSRVLASAAVSGDASSDELPPGVLPEGTLLVQLGPRAEQIGTATIDQTQDVVRGTLDLTELGSYVGDSDSDELAPAHVTVPFSCPVLFTLQV